MAPATMARIRDSQDSLAPRETRWRWWCLGMWGPRLGYSAVKGDLSRKGLRPAWGLLREVRSGSQDSSKEAGSPQAARSSNGRGEVSLLPKNHLQRTPFCVLGNHPNWCRPQSAQPAGGGAGASSGAFCPGWRWPLSTLG